MTFGNKTFCRDHGIRLSGRAPKKEAAEIEGQSAEQQELFKSDLRKRSVIEGRIGTSNRNYARSAYDEACFNFNVDDRDGLLCDQC